MSVFDIENPYSELSVHDQDDQWVELWAERQDIFSRLGDLSLEAKVNEDHIRMCAAARGLGVIVVTTPIELVR